MSTYLHTIVCPCGSHHTARKPAPYKYQCPDCGRHFKCLPDQVVVYAPGEMR